MKLCNMASLDPHHQKRGVGGLKHASKMDREVWESAHTDWDRFLDEAISSKQAISPMVDKQPVESVVSLDDAELRDTAGATRETTVRARIGQSFFREMILAPDQA